tara:strand:- start:40 stop:222 length:183 start_codon:yes stop_codon:yes gene_type:complete
MNNKQVKYFCIDVNGKLQYLGYCIDIEQAEENCNAMGIDSVWFFGEENANNWKDFLNKQL